jgi:hypothetical protein
MSRQRHWWQDENYPRSRWSQEDWADWEAHGRPRTPRDKSASPLPRLDQPPVPVPTHLIPEGFGGLNPKPGRKGARRDVNRLLSKLGLR